MNYYLLEDPDGRQKHILQTEGIHPGVTDHFLRQAPGDVAYGAGSGLRRGPPTYLYRTMCEAEHNATISQQRLQHNIRSPETNAMWLSESLEHQKTFVNKGVKEPPVVVEFEQQRREYRAIRNQAIPQKSPAGMPNSSEIQKQRLAQGKPRANLYHHERLPKDGPMRNIGMKGADNIDKQFNKAIISVKKVDPHHIPTKSSFKNWIKTNKLSIVGNALGVIADGVTLTFAILDDKGEFGNSVKLAIGDIAGSLAGAEAGITLASAVGTAFCPGLGTVIGFALGLIGSLIGALIGRSIASFFLMVEWQGEGPGAPIMYNDPYTQQGPSMGVQTGAWGVPSMGLNTGASGVPSMGLQTGACDFPTGNYLTRRDFDKMRF
ncbi:hypothetical protein GJAV_G00088620 [Gymnothorax javanicus]|nr:hypothetical protein GJAV_G00088620 [Gymnothorax javanicus]